jgi:hypothetical protein
VPDKKRSRVETLMELWHQGKISGLEFSRRASQMTNGKRSKTKRKKKNKRFSKIDRKYNPHFHKIVSGGLPELGKRR